MFKTILVPIDSSDTSLVAVDYAIDLSRSFNSEIEGISIIDIKKFPRKLFLIIFPALQSREN